MRTLTLSWLLASVALAALLSRYPLTAVPSYEPGVAVGLLAAAGLAMIAFERASRRPAQVTVRWGVLEATPGESVWRETLASMRAAALLVGLPLAVLASQALADGCRLAGGVGVFLFIALPAALAGMAMGALAGSVTRSRRRGFVIVMSLVALTAAWSLIEVAVGPRTFAHNLIVGPVSGSAFLGADTGLSFPPSAYLHRAFAIVAWCATLVLAALVRTRRDAPAVDALAAVPPGDPDNSAGFEAAWHASRADARSRAQFLLSHEGRRLRRTLAIVCVLSVPFLLMPARSGLLPGRTLLERAMPLVVETDHARLHYAQGSPAEAHLPRLAVEIEHAHAVTREVLGIDPQWKLDAWLHPDAETLWELTGARNFLFARPWDREFHVLVPTGGRVRSLRHELVHVVVADRGIWPFRASMSPAFTEGIATAVDEGFARIPEAHEQIAAAASESFVPAASTLLSPFGFMTSGSDRSYRSSGSFIGWLLMNFPRERVMDAYARADVERALGLPLDELDARWKAFLRDDVRPNIATAAAARARFDPSSNPAFVTQPCARLGMRAVPVEDRALLATREGFPDWAAELYCEAADASLDPALYDSASLARTRAGQWSEALRLADRALSLSPAAGPRREALLRRRVRLLARLGRRDDALVAWAAWRDSGLSPTEDEVALEKIALDDDERRDEYFAAVTSSPPEDARRLGALLERTPDFLPALNQLVSRADDRRPLAVEHGERVLRLAGLLPPGPLAARRLLDLARAHEDALEWDKARQVNELVLALEGGVRASQRLEATDGAARSRLAGSVILVGAHPRGLNGRQ